MNKSIFVLLVITFNVALGMTYRLKRQSSGDENKLDDRYSWDETSRNRPRRQNQERIRWTWQNQGGHPWPPMPRTSSPPTPLRQTTTPPVSTTSSSAVQQCIRNCPVTPEYNPVCGTNMVQYTNVGRLGCAKFCGVNVDLLRMSRCPTT